MSLEKSGPLQSTHPALHHLAGCSLAIRSEQHVRQYCQTIWIPSAYKVMDRNEDHATLNRSYSHTRYRQ